MIVSQANDRHVQQEANIQHELPEREVTKSGGDQFVDLSAVCEIAGQLPNRPTTAQPLAISRAQGGPVSLLKEVIGHQQDIQAMPNIEALHGKMQQDVQGVARRCKKCPTTYAEGPQMWSSSILASFGRDVTAFCVDMGLSESAGPSKCSL